MSRNRVIYAATLVGLAAVLMGAGKKQPGYVAKANAEVTSPGSITGPVATSLDVKPHKVEPMVPTAPATSTTSYALDWWSINSGGLIAATSAHYTSGFSVGQTAVGSGTSANYTMGTGFWYGATTSGCQIAMSGDVNTNGSVTSADIIYLVGYVFKSGPAPLPCTAAGDVNCNGAVTSADIIYLVGYVFKSGSAPCDACTSSLASTCP